MTTRPTTRPARRVFITHSWASQEWQYDRPDITPVSGIIHWTVPEPESHGVPIECLLAYNDNLELIGILNYYPQGNPMGDLPGDILVLVRPNCQRRGIGRSLIAEALKRWPIDLAAQAFTDDGWALTSSILNP